MIDINEYVRLAQNSIDDAEKYRMAEAPTSVFKFLPLYDRGNPDINKRNIETIEEKSIWASKFSSLNDPFEFKSFYLDEEKIRESGNTPDTFEEYDNQINSTMLDPIDEVGLKELIQDAAKYYDESNMKIAVEKLWDGFERLKTYYSPALDKKQSANKIIDDMSNSKAPYKDLFDKEFIELTAVGNNFRIRHHETGKIEIEDDRHYEYFYKRCLSLITVAIKYLV